MSLVPSLLQAILKVDGEALVMHAGEKPYVVAPAGQIELASRGLTLEAVDGIVSQLLPPEMQRALDEFGAVQYELPAAPEFPREHFTVVAARGGDDLWVEIRHRRVPAEDDRVPDDLFPPRSTPARAGAAVAERPVAVAASPVAVAPPPVVAPPLVASPAIAATVAPLVIEPAAVVPPAVPPVVAVPAAAGLVAAPVVAEPSTIADAAPVADVLSTHAQHSAYQETVASHEAVAHHEPAPRQESVAYQEPVREDDDLSLGDFGRTDGWYEEEEEEEKEIDVDDGLTLPDADQLFGKRREAEPDYDEEFEQVGELLEGEEYGEVEEYEEVEEFEDGDEFEIGLDVPVPSQPALAAQIATPAPAMFAAPPVPTPLAPLAAEAPFGTAPPSARVELPPRSVFAEVSQPLLLVSPPIVEAPRPLAQVPPPVVEEPQAVAEMAPPQAAFETPAPVLETPEPVTEVPAPVVEAVAAFETPKPVTDAQPSFISEPPAFETSTPLAVVEEPQAVAEMAPPEAAFETPAPVLEPPEPVTEVPAPVVEAVAAFETPEPVTDAQPSFISEPPAFETSTPLAVVEEPQAVAEMAPAEAAYETPAPAPVFETPEPVADVQPSFVSEPPAFEASTPLAVVEEPPAVAEMAPPEAAFETPAPVFETPEPVAEVPPPVVEAVAAFETPEPVAEDPSPELDSPSYAELPPVVAAAPTAPVFELVAPVFETETVEEVPPPPVEAFAAHAELPFPVAESTLPTATLFEPPAESAVEPTSESDVDPEFFVEESESRPSWAARMPPPATVLSMSRNPIRSTDVQPPTMADPTMSGLDRLLRVSAARGASTLYLSTDAQPSVRVDGELQTIDGEPVLSARDVESLLLTLMPERSHEALRTGAATEWFCDIDVVGRVRCLSFRDHRGPGGVFRLMPTRSVSVDQLGLPRSVQALAIEPEGLVLVAGPRSSGKRTLLSAFVDQINKTRRDHIITIEREVNIVHEQSRSFVSQREVRGNDDDMLVAARAALREDPDVLVIEDLRTAALMNVALEAAAAGRLVVAGFSAHTAAGAIDRIIDLYPPENRGQVQLALADSLRGVIVQVLRRRTAGGRVPAREVHLNTPAVSSVIAEGKTSQLAMAIEGGRRYGMLPINDGLVTLVQNGVVDAREAYRRSTDRPGFLAALKRHGIDTSFVERLA